MAPALTRSPRPLIILYAKAPSPGRVKTRLRPLLTDEAAAALHHAFVNDLLERLLAAGTRFDLELATDEATCAWSEYPVGRSLQSSGTLGDRMRTSLENALTSHVSAAIMGADSPTLPLAHLDDLLASQADVALGPADDGGFYAIACRRTHPEMFRGVRWSTAHALQDTQRAIEACGLTVRTGLPWYDVDDAAGLERLVRDPDLPAHIRRWQSQWLR